MADIKTQAITDEEIQRLSLVYETFRCNGQSYVRAIPGNCVLPAAYEKFKSFYRNWKILKDDIYVFAFPKNGTTWTEELVWMIENNCDFERGKAIPLNERVPFMDNPFIFDILKEQSLSDVVTKMAEIKAPRIFNGHLRFCLLPDDFLEKCKVVLCLRNPKDTVVSFYHHEKLIKAHGFVGDFATYFDLFMDNLVIYGSYFDYVTEAWQKRNHPNLCLIFYEDMKKDQATSIKKVAKFLRKELKDKQIEALVDHLSFKNMKSNAAVNKENFIGTAFNDIKDGRFMRKGEIGDWKNYFTEEMNRRMDEAIEKYLKPIGLEFQYE